ncbi:helix-turn-helix transcriptional regulator [Aureibacter tunicatorum]|uniref:AraC-like DNA-binding protein n=1 Tax=Aureibacter tunicatorum TaxID=866807 RepID=A0AAE4BQC0_9BACT|nr:AraC family transcriptional regulator [Aureibacter tunicatorum]MDR6238929.1 AraC-like DNA-binding protein [Aureibacter tunicatorum]BDD05144.1 hypothetical protein AUTU_26270 [Aureibacter tunicatorum]
MKEFVFEITDLHEQLKIWQTLFGGEIMDNTLHSPLGIVECYEFDTHDILIMKAKAKEPWFMKRIQQPDMTFYPIWFTNTFSFSEVMDNVNDLDDFNITKSNDAGILFTNFSNNIAFESPAIFHNVVVRLRKNLIFEFVPEDHPLVNIFKKDKPFYWYESFSPAINSLYKQIMFPPSNYSKKITRNILKAQSWELISHFFEKLLNRDKSQFHNIGEAYIDKIQMAKTLLLKNLHKPISLDQLSQEVGLSKTSLQKYFKIVFGMSVHKFFQNYRMDMARNMILSGKCNVGEAAINVGYLHFGHFSAEFKKKFGVLPSELSQ